MQVDAGCAPIWVRMAGVCAAALMRIRVYVCDSCGDMRVRWACACACSCQHVCLTFACCICAHRSAYLHEGVCSRCGEAELGQRQMGRYFHMHASLQRRRCFCRPALRVPQGQSSFHLSCLCSARVSCKSNALVIMGPRQQLMDQSQTAYQSQTWDHWAART